MKIKRIEHIAIAVKNMAPLKELLEGKLGIAMEYEESLPQYNTKLQMYPVGQTYLELLESDKPDTATGHLGKVRGSKPGTSSLPTSRENIAHPDSGRERIRALRRSPQTAIVRLTSRPS